MTDLYLVIPCYNEEEVLNETSKRLKNKLDSLKNDGKISENSRVIFVDDGSKDNTWEIIKTLNESDSTFLGCKLSRNCGHQNALLAGLSCAIDKADAIISMDADLQDDIDAIDKFLKEFEDGYEIVYGVRSSRKKDSWFKRTTAEAYYKFMKLMGVEIVFNHADYRLMSNRALKGLFQFKEVNLFLRGLVPMIGYKSTKVFYERNERFAGESKYPLKKMLKFAFEGITSLSVKPIRFITVTGIVCFLVSIIMLIYTFISYFTDNTTIGWSSLITSIWAIGGLQLLGIGVVGEYISKIYLETKQRPRFIIEEFLNKEPAFSFEKDLSNAEIKK